MSANGIIFIMGKILNFTQPFSTIPARCEESSQEGKSIASRI